MGEMNIPVQAIIIEVFEWCEEKWLENVEQKQKQNMKLV